MTWLDWLVLCGYGLALALITARVGRAAVGAAGDDWLLAGRSAPTWAVWGSMLATELSAATFIGVPHAAYSGDWTYLQFAWGALLGKFIAAHTFIPLYRRLGVVTVYGFMRLRFGPGAQRASAAAFVVGRLLASGVRLYIAALAFAVVSGMDLSWSIALCGGVASIYTVFGGLRAVIWTDLLQALVFLTAAGVCGWILFGGGEVFEWARSEGKLRHVFAPTLDSNGASGIREIYQWLLTEGRAFWAALVGGCVLTLATHTTDHDMVQRLLATKSEAGGARALIGSAWSNIPITILFLAIGTGLAYFYSQGAAYDISDSARIFPLFAFNELPAGLRGLVFAGLFAAAMSSLDSAICAIGATLVSDIAPKRVPRSATRWLSALVGLLLVVVAWWMQSAAEGALSRGLSLVEFALSAMTVIYGGLLGVFALGWVHPRRGSDLSVQLGLGFGAVTGLALFLQGPLGVPSELQLAWPWWIPTSACVAFAIAALGSSSSTAQSGLGEQEQAHG